MGPNIQKPAGPMMDLQIDDKGEVVGMTIRPEWAAFFQSVQQVTFGSSRSGSTSARPTSLFPGRYVGMPFFDQTLGLPVFLKHASSDVWVDATGTPA